MHDIPLYADGSGSVLNMVVEIPRWTNAKMEVRVFFLQLLKCIILTSDQAVGSPQPHHAGC